MTRLEEYLISIFTGNPISYIREVANGKVEEPSVKNNWWGLGADKYYQGVISGIVKVFAKITFLWFILCFIFLTTILLTI